MATEEVVENVVETEEEFEARIASIESGSNPIEQIEKNHGADKMDIPEDDKQNESDNTKDDSDDVKEELDDKKAEDVNSGTDDVVDDDDGSDNDYQEDIKEDDDSIEEDEHGEDINKSNNVDNEVLGKFGIKDENELKDILSELKRANVILEDNKKYIENGKLLDKAEISDEDLGMLIAIKNGDKATVLDLVKKMNIDINDVPDEKVEPKKIDIEEFKQSDFDRKLDDFIATAKVMSVDTNSLNSIVQNFDEDSVMRLLDEPDSQKALLENYRDGTYQKVHEKIKEIEDQDYLGRFSKKTAYEKYAIGLKALRDEEARQEQQKVEDVPKQKPTKKVTKQKKVTKETKQEVVEDDNISSSFDTKANSPEIPDNVQVASTENMDDDEFDEYINNILNS
jgi:hypothetical protein